jgi:nuclear pore complex protein Nup205
MNAIHRLRDVLQRVLASPDASHNAQGLFDELMVQKAQLLKLFDVGPRSTQEQKEIESGKYVFIYMGKELIL